MKNKLKTYLLLGLLLCVCSSCIHLFEDETTEDFIQPNLPMYTELGKNTLGAMINENPWRGDYVEGGFFGSGSTPAYFEYFKSADSLILTLEGFFPGYEDDLYIRDLHFILSKNGWGINELSDLTGLRGKRFDLHTQDNFAVAAPYYMHDPHNNTDALFANEGELRIIEVKPNPKNNGAYIITGTFWMEAGGNNQPNANIYYGRFDIGHSEGQFEVY